jgi:ABC-type lipoprotein release transport system permease subunit
MGDRIEIIKISCSYVQRKAASDLSFGLTAADVSNIVTAGLVMVAVALAACILPARRATTIDVLIAIRNE